ncbi:hypothetical protein [Pantoea vagans]|uniref:hypothetical protein n=1 Tax=Pantoea vagans TaxID=470934 RepID=UPI0028A28521|nr:hypothetical protein [Pantoea vagans]
MEWFDKNAAAIIAASAALSASLLAGVFALLGAWANHIFTNKRFKNQIEIDERKENKKLYIEKGEELHSLLIKWGNVAFANFLTDQGYLTGRLTKAQSHELMKDKYNAETFTRISTLIAIYFPELKSDFEKVRDIPLQASSYVDKYEANILPKQQACDLHNGKSAAFDPLLTHIKETLQKSILRHLKG